MIRLLHLADVHLGASMSSFGDLAAKRREAVLEAFRQLPDRAREEQIDVILIAGDLFDGPDPEAGVLAAVAETFDRARKAGFPVLVVPGNHDSATLHPNPWQESLGGAHVFLQPAFDCASLDTPEGPLHVYGVAYDRAREPDPLATFQRTEQPGVHVVLLHGSVPFSPHWDVGGNALALPVESLAGLECDYVALGDYHSFRGPDVFDGVPVPACYSGSFAAVDLTETGPRGYAVVDLEPGRDPIVRHRPVSIRPVQDVGEIDVGGCADHGAVVERVDSAVRGDAIPVVRLMGVPDFPLDEETLRARLVERYGHVGLEDASRYYASDRLDEIAANDTVAGHVVREGRLRIEEAPNETDRRIGERALRLALQSLGVR